MTRILILAPYPWGEAPSQRFRFELLLKNTQESGVRWDFQSFYSTNGWKKLYETSTPLLRLWLLVTGFVRRKMILLKVAKYDYVLVHREITPIGPPIFEWFISKVLRKKLIFDFDDAIWMNDGHDGALSWWLKSRWKIRKICRLSWKVSAGNEFLADYARQYCNQVGVIPTVVNTQIHQPNSQKPKAKSQFTRPKQSEGGRPVIGWTGSHSTLFYLDSIIPILQELEKDYDFEFLVIANKNPELPLKNFRFIKWNKESEIDDLEQIDIGIMPLEDTEWAKGKCGFKLIQYGALAIPSVASPVGVNSAIIEHGVNGFLAETAMEWKELLEQFIKDNSLRKKMGVAARSKIESEYSVQAVSKKFVELFTS